VSEPESMHGTIDGSTQQPDDARDASTESPPAARLRDLDGEQLQHVIRTRIERMKLDPQQVKARRAERKARGTQQAVDQDRDARHTHRASKMVVAADAPSMAKIVSEPENPHGDIRRTVDVLSRQRTTSRLYLGLGVVLLIGAVAGMMMATIHARDAAEEALRDEQHIQELQAQLDSLGVLEDDVSIGDIAGTEDATAPVSTPDDLAQTAREIADEVATVRQEAEAVAVLQNRFAQLTQANPETPGNGAPSQGFLDAVHHRATLTPYFGCLMTQSYSYPDHVLISR